MYWKHIREFNYQIEYEKELDKTYHTFFKDGLTFSIDEPSGEIEVYGKISSNFLKFIEDNKVELIETKGKGVKYESE